MNKVLLKTITITYCVVIMVLIVFVFLAVYRVATVDDIPKVNNVNLLDIGSLKTGDILTVAYDDLRNKFSAVFYSSLWTHVGIVYIDPETNETFIIEAANYKPPYNGKIIKIPILYWLRINVNTKAIGVLRLNKPIIDSGNLYNSYLKYSDSKIGIEGIDTSWFRFWSKKTFENVPSWSFYAPENRKMEPEDSHRYNYNRSFIKAKKRIAKIGNYVGYYESSGISEDYHDYMLTCTEIAIDILQNAGIYSKQFTPCSFLPNEIINRKVPMSNGYEYRPVEVVDIQLIASDQSRYL